MILRENEMFERCVRPDHTSWDPKLDHMRQKVECDMAVIRKSDQASYTTHTFWVSFYAIVLSYL